MTDRSTLPNVLVIMSDDQGAWAMGCAGNSEIRTPNLDRLAGQGVRFTNFFCTSPVCSPARASFLTGMIPSQHGIHDWLRGGNIRVEDGITHLGKDRPIEYLRGLTGFTDVLAANGYTCGLSGKWHLGDSARPQKGHSCWHAHSLGGASYVDYHVFQDTPELVHKTQYVTDYFTDRALDFLDRYGDARNPFCLSLHYTAPHSPWTRENHPAELFDSYADCAFDSIPDEPAHPWNGWAPSPEQRRQTLQGYFAAVTAMDATIGRVVQRLEDLGLRDNTLIVFLSDNGMNMGHHGICGKGNGTYPLNMYDTSVKIPLIVSCPGQDPQGVVDEGLYSQYDFMPTLLDYLGLSHPDASQLPGRSFASALTGSGDDGRDEVVVFDEYGPVRMIRDHEWKYVCRHPDGPDELYWLVGDPEERTNVVDQPRHRRVIDHMKQQMEQWFARYVEPSRDGISQPVRGKGQIGMVDTSCDGPPGFAQG